MTKMITKTVEEQWWAMTIEWHIAEDGKPYAPGRNDLPAALFDTYFSGGFRGNDDLFRWALAAAYSSAEWPCLSVDADMWAEWFEEAGYAVNGVTAEKPDKIPTLWRAQVGDEESYGLSWTDDRDTAYWFHDRNVKRNRETPRVLRLDRPPVSAVLARFTGEVFRDEKEWILHPDVTYEAVTE